MENDITIPFGIQVPEPSDLAPYLGKGIDLPTFGGKMSVQRDPESRSSRRSRHALDTVAAFFGWMSSNAEQLKPDMRWKVILAYAFRLLLIPDPSLRSLVPTR